MSFDNIVLRSAANPSRVVNRLPGMGTLAVSAPADIALPEIENGKFKLVDSQRNVETAKQRITSRLTICRGKRLRERI